MEHADYYLIGSIVRTHGVRGNVISRLDVDNPAFYRKLKEVFLEDEHGALLSREVEVVSVAGDHITMHINGVDDMDLAATLIRKDIYLPLSELPPLKGKDIYLHEAIGMKVIDKHKGEIGVIGKIYELPEQPVCSIRYGDKEVLIPLLKVFIEKVDREEGVLYMDLPEGLVDLYLS